MNHPQGVAGLGDYYEYVKEKYGLDEATRNTDPVCYFSLPNTQLRTCRGASPTRTTTPSSTASASDRRRRRRRYRSRYLSR